MRDGSGDEHTQSYLNLSRGTQAGRYRIVDKIGSGGMGEVYLAEDTELVRQVALKFLPRDLCQSEECRSRFRREAQAVAKLDHPNIVTIYEVGEYDNRPFFAMQHIDGRTLREIIRDQAPVMEQALDWATQLCSGLKEAHEAGIVHRDIKPSNILIDSKNRARLVDFGLAAVRGTDELTKTGSTLGTAGYMSPEQVRGERSDERSDIFSMGVVIYEIIAGRPPFHGENMAATLQNILHATPALLSSLNPRTPPDIQTVIDKSLAKKVIDRYQSIADLMQELQKIQRKLSEVVSPADGKPSIAVMPFANLSADPEQEYFCDGMAEEIINALTQLENLRVVARTSCFAFKNKQEDIRQIGQKLNVDKVLEGSVRKVGSRIRVTAQLINVSDGYHLWSERFDRELEDVFAIQDEITLAIVDKLKVKLLGREKKALKNRYQGNIEAYNLYLKGRYHWNKRSTDALYLAIECFEKVIEIDAEYALAYAGLADCYNILPQNYALRPHEAYPHAKEYARKALDLDDSLAEAHASLASVLNYYDWDFAAAERGYKRAIELNPRYATAHHWYGVMLACLGRHREAIAELELARECDPLSPIIYIASAIVYASANQFEKAEEFVQKTRELYPAFAYIHGITGYIYILQHKEKEAINEFLKSKDPRLDKSESEELAAAFVFSGPKGYWQKLLEILAKKSEDKFVPKSPLAMACFFLKEYDKGFEYLEQAFLEKDRELVELKKWCSYDEKIGADPRFGELLKKIGLD